MQHSAIISPDLIGALVNRLESMLGTLLDDLRRTDEKGQRSITQPKRRHRLMVLLKSAETTAISLRDGKQLSLSEAHNIVELHDAISLLEDWRDAPAFPEIIKSMRNLDDYPHAVIMFAAANTIHYDGHSAELYTEQQARKRAADLRIVVPPHGYIAVEVKTPLELRDRHKPLHGDCARSVIKEAIRSAGVSSGSQLDRTMPGILLLGCFRLSEKDTDRLAAEAQNLFYTKDITRYDHIMGIIILNLVYRTDISTIETTGNAASVQNGSSGWREIRIARNPIYAREIIME